MFMFRYPFVCCVVLLTACGGAAAAEESDHAWLAPWQRLPVLHDGRIKPADTFARQVVEAVCGRESPRLSLAGAVAGSPAARGDSAGEDPSRGSPELAEARKLFPDGKLREFSAAELLLSWIVEPQRWERVPFLSVSNEQLRRDLLNVPIEGPDGARLKFASPWQVARAAKFHARWNESLEEQRKARAAEKPFEPTRLDKAVSELAEAYVTYRLVSFRPEAPDGVRRRFLERLAEVAHTWRDLEPDLEQLPRPDGSGGPDEVAAVSDAMKQLLQLAKHGEAPPWIPLKEADSAVVQLRQAAAGLPGRIEAIVKRFAESPPEVSGAELERVRVRLRAMAAAAANLVRLSGELHLALYDNGRDMAILPALNAAALEQDRDPKEELQPWLSIRAVLFGSDRLLRDYPQAELAAVRRTFQELAAVDTNREDPSRAARLGPATESFVEAVRALGEAVEPLRENLPVKRKDEALFANTSYPPPGFTGLEVHYNRLDPFMWTWILSLAAVAVFALALGKFRAPMFWLAMLLVSAGQGAAIYGLGLRTAITGRAPVTNMFETVVFVALVVALLGSWFALLPLSGRGLRAAWQWAAVPGTWEVPLLGKEELALFSERAWGVGHWVLLAPRAVLAYYVFAACALVPYGEGEGSTAIGLLPRTDAGASMPTVSDLTVWIVGLAVLVLCVWYLPRAIVATATSLFSVPYVLATQGVSRPLAQVVSRKPFVTAGAMVAFLTAYLACYAPVFDHNISPLMPVLRHNFWLTSHVMTITASYGAGALAWALGNFALAYYLFGRYRDPVGDTLPADIAGEHRPAGDYHAPPGTLPRRAPEICNTLGASNYRATQVAVLLLAAGTILGALWADVSWGRFWGWDRKEVWALISLLIYLAVLHGRYAGWFGNFGLAVGSVLGATAILMAWYGVNFVIGSDKHGYGEGTGGVGWVLAAVALNWAFVLAAAVRYHVEVRVRRVAGAERRVAGAER
jgi:ABC-type transport system involved in cytochrome c biogenesis permease subunit